jgi:tRNA-intron endonuclease
MNPATAELQEDHLIVTKPKDVGRLFNKSRFGTPLSKNQLHLDLIEGCFLVEENKLVIYSQGKKIHWEELVSIAASNQQTFETRYLIFTDLRRRGHQLKLLPGHSSFTFFTKNQQEQNKPPALIATFSEREQCTIQTLSSLITLASKQQNNCWIAIADEEGDITYYELDSQPLTGSVKPESFKKTDGLLLQDRVLIFNESIAQKLHEQEFFGKRFGKGLQISLVEALYLVKKIMLNIKSTTGKKLSEKSFEKHIRRIQPDIAKRYEVYCDLKKQGLIVKTGFKFGNHFRAYTSHPDRTHAEYLVHAIPSDEVLGWAEISRAIRLAHSVNKTFLFASIEEQKKVVYLAFKRIRP